MKISYPNVKFMGKSSNLAHEMCERHIFLYLTNYNEGVPKVLCEAMAAGCCVVVSDAAGCVELIENNKTELLLAGSLVGRYWYLDQPIGRFSQAQKIAGVCVTIRTGQPAFRFHRQ